MSIGSEPSPICVTQLRPFQALATPRDAGFEITAVHGGGGMSALSSLVTEKFVRFEAESRVDLQRPSGTLGSFGAVGSAFAPWRGVMALMPLGDTQGQEFHVKLPGKSDFSLLFACFQEPRWSAGGLTSSHFWLALSPAGFCNFCSGEPGSHALLQYSVDGALQATVCFEEAFGAETLLHSTQAFGAVLSANVTLFEMDDAGIKSLFDAGQAKVNRHMIYPFSNQRRVLLQRNDGGWEDAVWRDGMWAFVPSIAQAKHNRVHGLFSGDGQSVDIVQSGSTFGYAQLTRYSNDGGVRESLFSLPNVSSSLQYDYVNGQLAVFYVSESDDGGMRSVLGQLVP